MKKAYFTVNLKIFFKKSRKVFFSSSELEYILFQTHPGNSSFTVIHSSFLQTATGRSFKLTYLPYDYNYNSILALLT